MVFPRNFVAAAALCLLSFGPASAAGDPIGIWTLSMPGTPRQCRLQLRADPAATGQAIAMPPGCRRAFPILGQVRSWSVPDGIHVGFNDESGVNILMFAEGADGQLQAAGPESEAAYLLTPVGTHRTPVTSPNSPAIPDSSVTAAAAPVAAAAETVAVPRPPATVAATAGHYAVMRGSRDTGCMVTLDEAGRNAAELKARLAPACRDQGIIIFDPVGWSLKSGRLVLAARRGHTAVFSADAAGTWVKDATTGPSLGLKRL